MANWQSAWRMLGRRARRPPVLPRPALRPGHRVPAELHRPRRPAALAADRLRRLAGILVRRQLRPRPAEGRGIAADKAAVVSAGMGKPSPQQETKRAAPSRHSREGGIPAPQTRCRPPRPPLPRGRRRVALVSCRYDPPLASRPPPVTSCFIRALSSRFSCGDRCTLWGGKRRRICSDHGDLADTARGAPWTTASARSGHSAALTRRSRMGRNASFLRSRDLLPGGRSEDEAIILLVRYATSPVSAVR